CYPVKRARQQFVILKTSRRKQILDFSGYLLSTNFSGPLGDRFVVAFLVELLDPAFHMLQDNAFRRDCSFHTCPEFWDDENHCLELKEQEYPLQDLQHRVDTYQSDM
ncbi:hypothetical protein Leryth_022812, partial [Lithospermum erythrorhizon]